MRKPPSSDLLGRTDQPETVADIGAGTGQLARLFAPHCRAVYAVEPDPAMRHIAHEALADTTVTIVDAAAECTTLDAQSIELIVVGNAFHRFRREACDEFARILKPRGWVAIFSYTFLDRGFQESLSAKLASIAGLTARSKRAWHRIPLGALFGESEVFTLEHELSCIEGWDEFFGAAQAGIESPEQTDAEFGQFEKVNRELFEEYAVDGRLVLHYKTHVAFGRLQ